MKRYDPRPLVGMILVMLAAVPAFAQKARPSVSTAEVTGTFRMNLSGRFRDSFNEIEIASTGRAKIRVAMDLIYPFKMSNGDDMANIGQLDGEFAIAGDTATYVSDSTEIGPCKITIKFVRPGTIKVAQDGSDAECGFGHNVFSDGTYRKVSGKKPKFEMVK
jgi:hypothetical protein